MFSETLFSFIFTGLMSFGNPPFFQAGELFSSRNGDKFCTSECI